MSNEPKKLILLEGGPLDGCTLEVDPRHGFTEVLFRATEYFPGEPREVVYRFRPDGALTPRRIALEATEGVRVFPYRAAERTALLARVEAQDVELRRLRRELDRLVAEVQRR